MTKSMQHYRNVGCKVFIGKTPQKKKNWAPTSSHYKLSWVLSTGSILIKEAIGPRLPRQASSSASRQRASAFTFSAGLGNTSYLVVTWEAPLPMEQKKHLSRLIRVSNHRNWVVTRDPYFARWFQSTLKMLVKLDHFTRYRGENKNIWNYHLDLVIWYMSKKYDGRQAFPCVMPWSLQSQTVQSLGCLERNEFSQSLGRVPTVPCSTVCNTLYIYIYMNS